eukprot:1155281-Pelagomonas_calceolata.AAC.1
MISKAIAPAGAAAAAAAAAAEVEGTEAEAAAAAEDIGGSTFARYCVTLSKFATVLFHPPTPWRSSWSHGPQRIQNCWSSPCTCLPVVPVVSRTLLEFCLIHAVIPNLSRWDH